MKKTHRVRVMKKGADPKAPAREDVSLGFSVEAGHADKAADLVRARLEDAGHKVLAISHAPERTVMVTVDGTPRVGPPRTVIAKVIPPAAPRRRGAR